MSIVKFKSLPEMYNKEKSGSKPNTIRKIDYTDERFIDLRKFNPPAHIAIVNTETNESFIRRITDYTEWEGYAIISWRHEVNDR